jgi:hypothetical protein
MARRGLLSILPRIIASLSSIWKAIYVSELKQKDNQEQASWTMGFPKVRFDLSVTSDPIESYAIAAIATDGSILEASAQCSSTGLSKAECCVDCL